MLRRAGAGEAQIVNTASAAGLNVPRGSGVYATSKFAVVGFSEALRLDLAGEGIGVSILCPGGVNTRIYEAARNRQPQFGGPAERHPGRNSGIPQLAPEAVAALAVRGIEENRLYIHTEAELRPWLARRFARIDGDFAALEGVATEGS